MESPAETGDERLRVMTLTSGGRRAILLTSDGVSIEAEHHPFPGGSARLAIVVAHGFTGALGRPAIRAAAGHFARHGGVVTFSFRGHGRSGGLSTVGDREVLDLDAAIRWARALGYERVATVGFSMGGSVVLRHAGRTEPVADGVRTGEARAEAVRESVRTGEVRTGLVVPDRVRMGEARTDAVPESVRTDAVVAVSSPARWYYRGTAPMRRLHWVVTRPAGRLVSRVGLRTRVHAGQWDPVPPSPVEAVPYIAPTPLLIVHGDRDTYFPLDHPHSLAAAAGPGTAELWIERGFGHAENAADPALLARIGAWLTSRVAAM